MPTAPTIAIGDLSPVTRVPDVSVIIPVYNPGIHLTACLDSLIGQTLPQERFEIVAVDDGSTDGSGELLDAYAAKHPELFTVVHQENSGGPAGPCNVALDLARGRFVFFLGSDDWLGSEALERMVTAADTWESDVVCVRLVGTHGREISQRLFEENQVEIPFPDQRPWLTANTKLFRRSVLEEHGVRYQESIREASDQTFTLEAMYRSQRISVLGDYDYYFAVLRPEGGNIMFRGDWRARLDAIEATMDYLRDLIGRGDLLDQVLLRHLKWEFGSRLRDIDELPPEDRPDLLRRTRAACDEYLTDGMATLLPVAVRLRLRHAQSGDADALHRLNASIEEHRGRVPIVVRDGRVHLAYPGFDQPGGFPPAWYAETHHLESLRHRLLAQATSVALEGDHLVVTATVAVDPVTSTGLDIDLLLPVDQEDLADTVDSPPVSIELTTLDDLHAQVRFAIPAAALVESGHKWRVQAVLPVLDTEVRARVYASQERIRLRYGDHVLIARANKTGGLALLARPTDPSAPTTSAAEKEPRP